MPWTLLLQPRNLLFILLALVTLFAGVQSLRLQTRTAERDLAVSNLESYKQQAKVIAEAEKEKSDNAIKEARNDYQALVEQTKGAYANYRKRFPAGCGVRLPNMPASSSSAETGSTEGTDATQREFVAACALDAGTVKLWQQWAVANELPIQ